MIASGWFAVGRVFVRLGKLCKATADRCMSIGTPFWVRSVQAARRVRP